MSGENSALSPKTQIILPIAALWAALCAAFTLMSGVVGLAIWLNSTATAATLANTKVDTLIDKRDVSVDEYNKNLTSMNSRLGRIEGSLEILLHDRPRRD